MKEKITPKPPAPIYAATRVSVDLAIARELRRARSATLEASGAVLELAQLRLAAPEVAPWPAK